MEIHKLTSVVDQYGMTLDDPNFGFGKFIEIGVKPDKNLYVIIHPWGSMDAYGYCDPSISLDVDVGDDIDITISKTKVVVKHGDKSIYYNCDNSYYDKLVEFINNELPDGFSNTFEIIGLNNNDV